MPLRDHPPLPRHCSITGPEAFNCTQMHRNARFSWGCPNLGPRTGPCHVHPGLPNQTAGPGLRRQPEPDYSNAIALAPCHPLLALWAEQLYYNSTGSRLGAESALATDALSDPVSSKRKSSRKRKASAGSKAKTSLSAHDSTANYINPKVLGPDVDLHVTPESDTSGQEWTQFQGNSHHQLSDLESQGIASGSESESDASEHSESHSSISSLTERQKAALPYLVAFPNAKRAASAAGIARSTLYLWLEDDSFRQELTRLREASVQLANEEFQSLRVLAAQVFREAMDHENMAYRISAARYVTNTGIRLNDMERLAQDLRGLQDIIAGSEN